MRKFYLRVAALICIGIGISVPVYSAFTSSSGNTQLGKSGDNVTVEGNLFTVNPSSFNITSEILKATSTAASFESVTGYGGGMSLDLVGSGQTYSTITDFKRLVNSSGWATGGDIAIHTSSVTIESGTGFIRANDTSTDTLRFFNWSESQVLMPLDTTRHIGVEYNSGSPQIVFKASDNWDLNTEFPLYLVIEEDGILHSTDHRHSVNNLPSRIIEWVHNVNHVQRDEETGGIVIDSTDTYVTVSSGDLWLKYIKTSISEINTHGSDTFDRYATDVPGTGFIKQSGVSEWDNARYDTGNGTATISNNRYSSQYFYMELDGNLICVYGRGNYVTLSAALNDTAPPFVPDRVSEHGLLIGRITFQEGVVIPSLVETVFTTQFNTAGVTDHNDLSNRSSVDAHTQYLLKAGDTMTGILDMDTYSIESSSSINANEFFGSGEGITSVDAETLDGFDSSYFLSTTTAESNYLTKSSATATYESIVNHNSDMLAVANSTAALDSNKFDKSGGTLVGQVNTAYSIISSSSATFDTLTVSSSCSALTYYGDGSNLTGIAGASHKITVFSVSIPGLSYQTNGIFYAPEIPYDCTVTSAIVTFGYDGTATSGASSIYDIKVSSGFSYYTIFNDTDTAFEIPDGEKRKGTTDLAVTSVMEGWGFRVDCLDDSGVGGDPWMITLWGTKDE